METERTFRTDEYEDRLVDIVRRLPPERVLQLVDFARFLEEQIVESEEEIRANQEKWDELLARPEAKRVMREMAREAVEDYHAGRTTDIKITSDGRPAPE